MGKWKPDNERRKNQDGSWSIIVERKTGEIQEVKMCDEGISRISGKRVCITSSGYAKVPGDNGKYVPLHRLLLDCDSIIDHINRDKLDNRICNLRQCTRSENGINANSKKKEGRTSTYKGVHRKRYGGYIASFRGKYLGSFKTEEEARDAFIGAGGTPCFIIEKGIGDGHK